MSETMKWSEMSDKDKVKLILQYVIPHDMGDDLIFKNGDIDTPKGKRAINWPIAAWDELLARWQVADIGSNGATIFDPLHDMNDAWSLLDNVTSHSDRFCGSSLTIPMLPSGERVYICRLNIYGREIVATVSTPMDAICIGLLREYGVEIEL